MIEITSLMKYKIFTKVLTLAIFIVFGLLSCKQQSRFTVVENILIIPQNGGQYEVSAWSEDIIKVAYRDSFTYSNRIYAPVYANSIPFTLEESKNSLTFKTLKVSATIQFSPFSITYSDLVSGTKLKDQTTQVSKGDSTFLNFQLKTGEAIYGTGFRALPLNRRGEEVLIYNRPQYGYEWGEKNLNYTFPHWMSSQDFMILVDNPARAVLDIGKFDTAQVTYKSAGGNRVYYFINGNSFEELIANYTTLTGRQPLPPRWAFGNIQSRFGYRSQQEAESILQLALNAGYPVDAIVLDIYWFGPELENGKMGQFDWDYEKWPDPKGMIKNFADKGVKTVVVSEPFFTRKSKHFQWLSDQQFLALDTTGKTATIPDFYFGDAGVLDIFKPDAAQWMWNQYRYLKDFGVAGWWVDLGEPEKHPDYMRHVNGTASEIHGAVGHEWAKMLHDGFEIDYPAERLFHLGRAGFAGTQRYGIIPWSGDVSRSWNGLKAQVPIMLSMGISGLGYMHSDAGGFSMVPKGDPELYTRWLQLAAFTPIFRPHADQVVAPEPVFWDDQTQQIVKKYIDLRYRLLPYNYTLAWKNSISGMPMMRPIFTLDENAADNLYQQYMWGDAFLVAAVTDPGRKLLPIYLPDGTWYNFHSGQQVEGNQNITVATTLEDLPIFVKAGSIVPMASGVTNAGDFLAKSLNIHYYLSDEPSSTEVYFDDGKSPESFEKGHFRTLKIGVNATPDNIQFRLTSDGMGYPDEIKKMELIFKVVGLKSKPSSIISGGQWDEEDQSLNFPALIKLDSLKNTGQLITIRLN